MIYLIENVFTNQERQKLIKDSQPLLLENLGEQYPGRQTWSDLHENPKFKSSISHILRVVYKTTGLNLVITKSWVNWTNGKKKDIEWHRHPSQYSLVYYMKIPLPIFSNGTLFKNGLFKVPQNSMIVFPGSMEHSAPSSPFRFDRYSLAMELKYG